nr:hypothetical protein [Xanthomonadaceae bacterium]
MHGRRRCTGGRAPEPSRPRRPERAPAPSSRVPQRFVPRRWRRPVRGPGERAMPRFHAAVQCPVDNPAPSQAAPASARLRPGRTGASGCPVHPRHGCAAACLHVPTYACVARRTHPAMR